MKKVDNEKLAEYFESIKDLAPEKIMETVEKHLDDETIEIFVDHIEEFYGVEDDEELGMLAQIMVSGFVAAIESKSI